MTPYELLRLVVYLIGVPAIVYLLVQAVRKVREIRQLDEQLREEEAQNATHPYADMARMYEIQQLLDRTKGRDKAKRGKKNGSVE